MSGIPGTAVVQVTNLSSAVSSEQMRTLFGFLGDIEELRLYPPERSNPPVPLCYIKYRDPSSVGVAQHLTNTVFVDRALIVVPCAEGECGTRSMKRGADRGLPSRGNVTRSVAR
uniref:Splicing regulatory glutamic acid and lysine rich protein 1 n=1 Tax=Scophthalmus maximus TaxID=52904 RepID=A0A8D3E234_SCOMX